MILNNGTDIAGFTASRLLKREHRVIERGLQAAEIMAGERVLHKGCWDKLMAFFKNFVEDCHHAKEEDVLFPILKSVPDSGNSVETVFEEHERGRTLLKVVEGELDFALNGRAESVERLCRVTREYIALLRRQIREEDRSVFALVDEMLGPEEQVLMAAVLDRADQVSGNAAKRDHYARLANELCQRIQQAETESAQTILRGDNHAIGVQLANWP
jgi:hemerythrin-like domain-containing protein